MTLRSSPAFMARLFAVAVPSLLALALSACREPVPEGTTVALFDPALSGSFFDFPWPSDSRLDAAGHADLSGFPNPENIDILNLYIEAMEQDIVGFGNNSPIYFRFNADIDASRLPALPSDSLRADATVFLVNIDEGSGAFGQRTPITASYLSEATMYSPSHLLGVAPAWGFPLLPSTTYAAVVRKDLEGADGLPLAAPADFARLLAGEGADSPALERFAGQLEPLRRVLEADDIALEAVAIATVFTTQDPISELGQVRDYLLTLPEPSFDPAFSKPLWYVAEDPDYEKVNEEEEALYPPTDSDPYDQKSSTSHDYLQFEGAYLGPNFQEGEVPYEEEGGAIVFEEGVPVVQRWESLRFCLAVPKGEPPPGGWPVAIFAHGTGGDYKNLLYSGTWTVAEMLIPRGIAVIGIDQPLHGPRAPEGTDPELMSFNFLNPDAARSNFRQAAIDVFYLTRFVRETLEVPAEVAPGGEAIRFDPERVSFVGHSHGGLSGALVAPFESDLRAYALSGAGGGLSLTILLRDDYVDFADLFRAMLAMPEEDPLDSFHPVMALVQTLVDVTDPLNYAPLFTVRPPDGRAKSVLQTEGFYDTATPPATCEAMVTAGRLPLLEPIGRTLPGLELQGIEPVAAPVSGNRTGPDGVPATAALAQFPDDNHYAIFRNYYAAALYADFIASVSGGQTATVRW